MVVVADDLDLAGVAGQVGQVRQRRREPTVEVREGVGARRSAAVAAPPPVVGREAARVRVLFFPTTSRCARRRKSKDFHERQGRLPGHTRIGTWMWGKDTFLRRMQGEITRTSNLSLTIPLLNFYCL